MPWNFDAEPHTLQAFFLMLAGIARYSYLRGPRRKKTGAGKCSKPERLAINYSLL